MMFVSLYHRSGAAGPLLLCCWNETDGWRRRPKTEQSTSTRRPESGEYTTSMPLTIRDILTSIVVHLGANMNTVHIIFLPAGDSAPVDLFIAGRYAH